MSAVVDLVAALRTAHDEACADYSAAQHALADADARRRALEAALVALEPLTGEEVVAGPLPVVDLLATKPAAAAKPKTGKRVTRNAKPAAAAPRDNYGIRVSADRLAEVARLAAEAVTLNSPPRNYVALQLGVKPVYAGQLLTAARRAGHTVPYERQPKISGGGAATRPAAPPPEPNGDDDAAASGGDGEVVSGPIRVDGGKFVPWTPRPGENVVCCDDCDTIYPSMSRFRLRDHIRNEHGREPSRTEMLPTAWAGEAS